MSRDSLSNDPGSVDMQSYWDHRQCEEGELKKGDPINLKKKRIYLKSLFLPKAVCDCMWRFDVPSIFVINIWRWCRECNPLWATWMVSPDREGWDGHQLTRPRQRQIEREANRWRGKCPGVVDMGAHKEFPRVLKVSGDEKRAVRDRGACSRRELLAGRRGERPTVLTAGVTVELQRLRHLGCREGIAVLNPFI